MKKMDEIGLWLCRYQGKLFEESVDSVNCSSPVFIRRFMNSFVARRMDSISFLCEATCRQNLFYEIDEEFGKSSYGIEKYNKEVMYWIGYIYKYWAYIDEKSSKSIYYLYNARKMQNVYLAYHSMDPLFAIERIKESTGYEMQDNIKKGVEILKELRKTA